MSETPRHESNGSGPRQHRKNSGGKDFRSKKGGKNFGGKGGFKRNDRGGKKFDGRRSDSRSKAPRSNGPEAEAPREEVRSIGGRVATAPQSPRHRKLTMTSPVASWTVQPSVSCVLWNPATQKPLQSTSPWPVATSTSTPNSRWNTPLQHPAVQAVLPQYVKPLASPHTLQKTSNWHCANCAPTAVLAAP